MSEQHKTEDGDLKTGFDRVYRREIEPHLDNLETKRRRRVRSFYLRIAVVGLFVAAGAAAVMSFELYRDYTFVVPVLFAAAVLIGYFVISAPARQQREEVKDLVIGPICDFLGELAYERKPYGRGAAQDRRQEQTHRVPRPAVRD
jgi:hypothetical protein